jgi:hypothetical protein
MNMTIYLFLLAGAGFGIITFPVRHLFSEGPHKADDTENADALSGRVFWVMVIGPMLGMAAAGPTVVSVAKFSMPEEGLRGAILR